MSTVQVPRSRRRRRGPRPVAVLAALGVVTALAAPALAVTATFGNPAVPRPWGDGYEHFTVVDTNNPAPFDGYFTSIDFFAGWAGAVRFVVVDSDYTVTWLSEVVEVAAPGAHTADFDEIVGVTEGSNLGFYAVGRSVVVMDYGFGAPAPYEANLSGPPEVGEPLELEHPLDQVAHRVYSLNAQITAASPEVCKKGGWELYGYPNQGQCIASVVAAPASRHRP